MLSNQPDALNGKATPNYILTLNTVFKLQMAKTVWINPDIAATGLTAHEMDGRFGWNLFEGEMVDINYDDHQ